LVDIYSAKLIEFEKRFERQSWLEGKNDVFFVALNEFM
jgi:hypothetical protein